LRGAVTPDVTYALELLIVTDIITVVGTLLAVVTIGVLGQSANYLSYPVLEVVREVRIGRNLERLDTLYILGVMSTIFIKLFVFHYAWCEGMKDVFKLSSHRIVTLSGSLLVWAGSIACFRSKEDVNHFMTFVAPSYFFGDVGWYSPPGCPGDGISQARKTAYMLKLEMPRTTEPTTFLPR
jgi:spore germination protein KB